MLQLLSELSVSFQRDKTQYLAISFIFYFTENTIKQWHISFDLTEAKTMEKVCISSSLSPTDHFYPL